MFSVLVWDDLGEPPLGFDAVCCWNDCCEHHISLTKLVDQNSESLKSRYLSWIRRLGEAQIQGESVVRKLEFHRGVSYWWMSLIFEKCNFDKSPHIADVLKLLVFSDYWKGTSISSITVVTKNKK